ncbi:hypothetical protein B0H11DRAFT_1926015 [Mycena galericulata]|nr:hypothetical protein B0H11DRAFT_1926015 [Mycena galericulata]
MWIFRENIALLGMILGRERSVAFFFEFTQRLALLWPQVRVVYRENPSKGMVSKMTATSTELCGIPGGVICQECTQLSSGHPEVYSIRLEYKEMGVEEDFNRPEGPTDWPAGRLKLYCSRTRTSQTGNRPQRKAQTGY